MSDTGALSCITDQLIYFSTSKNDTTHDPLSASHVFKNK